MPPDTIESSRGSGLPRFSDFLVIGAGLALALCESPIQRPTSVSPTACTADNSG